MQRITVKENGKIFTVKMPENCDMGKIFIEPTPLSTTELEGIKAKVKDALTMMLDVITNPDETSDNKLLVTIAVYNFIKMFEDARNSDNGDCISITFNDKNNIDINIYRRMKLDDDTYGVRTMNSVTFMLRHKGDDQFSPNNWLVKYSAYDRNGNTESLIVDYFEEGEETVYKLKTLIESVCTLRKA